jgi:hypothetical protein
MKLAGKGFRDVADLRGFDGRQRLDHVVARRERPVCLDAVGTRRKAGHRPVEHLIDAECLGQLPRVRPRERLVRRVPGLLEVLRDVDLGDDEQRAHVVVRRDAITNGAGDLEADLPGAVPGEGRDHEARARTLALPQCGLLRLRCDGGGGAGGQHRKQKRADRSAARGPCRHGRSGQLGGPV